MGACKACGEIFGVTGLTNGLCKKCIADGYIIKKVVKEKSTSKDEPLTKLVPCKVCGKEISKNAKMCPNCGESYTSKSEIPKTTKKVSNTYSHNPSMLNSPFVLLFFILLITAYGIGLIFIIIWKIYNINTTLTLSDDILSYTEGILSKDRQELKLEKVSTISVHQSLFDRILNIGDIAVYTTGDKPEILAVGFANPTDIKDAINNRR